MTSVQSRPGEEKPALLHELGVTEIPGKDFLRTPQPCRPRQVPAGLATSPREGTVGNQGGDSDARLRTETSSSSPVSDRQFPPMRRLVSQTP